MLSNSGKFILDQNSKANLALFALQDTIRGAPATLEGRGRSMDREARSEADLTCAAKRAQVNMPASASNLDEERSLLPLKLPPGEVAGIDNEDVALAQRIIKFFILE